MLALLRKKKLSEDRVANIFVNVILETIDSGFSEVAALINEDSEFERSPNIDPEDSDRFLLIVLAGNIKFIPSYFDNYQDIRLIEKVTRKAAHALGVDPQQLKGVISSYQSLFSRINHPSKNTHYAMSKAIFHKYELNDFQQEYFRHMKAPNPIFLKRLDEIVANFLFDWEGLSDKYRIVE